MSACVLARLHNLLYALLFVWLSFPSAFGFADSPASWRGQSVSEFTPAENKEFSWKIVNDGVMGGFRKAMLNTHPTTECISGAPFHLITTVDFQPFGVVA